MGIVRSCSPIFFRTTDRQQMPAYPRNDDRVIAGVTTVSVKVLQEKSSVEILRDSDL